MRARRLGITALVVLALAGSTGCGDDGSADADADADGDGRSGFADAAAVAEALGCTDTFQVADAEPLAGPVPESAGYCDGEGSPSFEVYGSEADVERIRRELPTVGCGIMQAFGIDRILTVVGANWMATPAGEPDPALAEELASTLGGEVVDVEC